MTLRPNPQHATRNQHLIIGAGLAGCVLARQMELRGEAFTLIGNPARPSAADVAAGIINPVTGRWMTKSWRIDDFAPEARAFYRALEAACDCPLYHPIEALRHFLNADDAKRAGRRARNPRYADVLRLVDPPGSGGPSDREFGSIRIRGAAWVDLPAVLRCLRDRYLASGQLIPGDFRHDALTRSPEGWCYGGHNYQQVFFCEGNALPRNPWFGWLPLRPAKGETLLCRSADWPLPDKLLHHEKWLLPYPDGRFRLGATYDEADADPGPTEAASQTLLEAFHRMTGGHHRIEVEQHLAGHRPGTRDARPLLGPHPTEPGLWLLNGLGAKGASLAPTLSRELCEHCFAGKALDPETDLRRFALT